MSEEGSNMNKLHKAALLRAYRTLAQGLGGSAVTSGLVALVMAMTDGNMKVAALTLCSSVASVCVAAVASFWQGVARGLPEAQ
jgi:hypothetical protein